MKTYLSGGIYKDNQEATDGWREEAAFLLMGDVINPCRGRAVYDPTRFTTKEIVSRDKLDIRNCDVVLVWGNPVGDHLSIGTWMECEYAHAQDKPIVIVSVDHRVLSHPWINEYGAKIFSTVNEACEYINRFWS